jgi:hypothetical protein
MAHHAYLEPIMGLFPAFDVHKARVISACLNMIGEDYNDFQACEKVYKLIDKEIKGELYDRFYDSTASDIYLMDSKEARTEFMALVKSLSNKG